MNRSSLQESVDETFNLIDFVIAEPSTSPEVIYDLKRFKNAIAEHLERGETSAACVYMLGNFSTNYLGFNQEGRQNQIGQKLENLIFKISGVHNQKELENKMKALQKAMNIIQKELLKTNIDFKLFFGRTEHVLKGFNTQPLDVVARNGCGHKGGSFRPRRNTD